jgi:IS30 family transposase
MSYKQLTLQQRYQISALKSSLHTQMHIAAIVGVHQSTISRELRRNQTRSGRYGPLQAHAFAAKRRRAKVRPKIKPQTWCAVETLINRQWSPEQIAGRLKYEGRETPSPERIYQHIYADKGAGGTLFLNLRCQKTRRKRCGSHQRRIRIRNRMDIELRPAVVERKERFGDWEADTIVGCSHQGALVSMVERKSKLLRLALVEQNNSSTVIRQMIRLMKTSPPAYTITSDNGSEFASHERITEKLGAQFYFAHPYCAWERGLNENTNGLIRQYFPKGCGFKGLHWREVRRVQERLNHRPRKTLGYRTPHEVFFQKNYALTT